METKTRKITYDAEAIWLARRRMKKTQEEIARAIKRTRQTVNRVEQGRHASKEVIHKICRELDLKPESILIS